MTLSLSVKDIHFIKYIFKYMNIFLLTPWYDFDKNDLYCPILYKIYGLFLLAVKIFWIVYTVRDEYIHEAYQKMFVSQKFIFAAITLNMMALHIMTIVKTCIWDGENWKTLITNFERLDTKLQNKGKSEACLLRNFYCRFFLKNVVFLLVAAYQMYVWSAITGASVMKMACMSCIKEIYYEFLIICLLDAIVVGFRSRYEDLNARLVDLGGAGEKKIREELQGLNREYRMLGANVEIFNRIFGHQMVLIIFHCGLELVDCLNIAFVSHMVAPDGFHTQILFAGLSLLVCVFYNFLNIVLPIDWTMQESQKFLLLSCQIQEKFVDDPLQLKGFIKLLNCSKDFVPKFNAAGYFKIDKGLIFSVVANVATYFIITIQLNEANIGYLIQKN